MKVYFTRHGQNEWNAKNIVCGVNDIPLNEKGKAQAKYLADKISDIGDIDIIVSSPLSRAKETAEIIAKKNYETYSCRSKID